MLCRDTPVGGFPTPMLRPAANPPIPPEFHLPDGALPLTTLFLPSLSHSSPGSRSHQPPSNRPEQLRELHEEDDEDAAEVEGGAWRTTSRALLPPIPRRFTIAEPAAPEEEARRRSASVVPRGRGTTQMTRARRRSWTRSNKDTPNRDLRPLRAASSTSLSGAHSIPFPPPIGRSTSEQSVLTNRSSISSNSSSIVSDGVDHLLESRTMSRGHRRSTSPIQGTLRVSRVPPATAVEDIRRGGRGGELRGGELRTNGVDPRVRFPVDTLQKISEGEEEEEDEEEEEGMESGDSPGNGQMRGRTSSRLRSVPHDDTPLKMLGDLHDPRSRGSISSIHTCSTRSSASAPAAPDELERAAMLSSLQELQEYSGGGPSNDGESRHGSTKREFLGDSAPPASGGAKGRGKGGRKRRPAPLRADFFRSKEEEEAVLRACEKQLLPHRFIGLSPAASRGLPDANEAPGVFERIWTEMLRQEAAKQRSGAPVVQTTTQSVVEPRRPRVEEVRRVRRLPPRGQMETSHQHRQQRPAMLRPVLLRAGGGQKT